jgi:dTDP-N-acetylfucosamine:lipid II N-acetylfucosaminyltransferase
MTRLVHLISDSKFAPFVSKSFSEVAGVENRFLLRAEAQAGALLMSPELKAWRVVDRSYFAGSAMRDDLEWCNGLVVHFLDRAGARMIRKVPRRVCVIWSGWGSDYYGLWPRGERGFWDDETAMIMKRVESAGSFGQAVRRLVRRVVAAGIRRVDLRCAAARVNLFSAPIPLDYDQVRAQLGPAFHPLYLQLYYGSYEETFSQGKEGITGENILVGNSATPTGNHLSAFKMLLRRGVSDAQIVVPLSYGDPGYRDEILASGRSMFGGQFVPLTEFMPLAEYNSIVHRCSIVVMNHKRQQAVGNIGAAMCRGARVFLDQSSTVFQFLRGRGAIVFPMNALQERGAFRRERLTAAETQLNQRVLRAIWGADVVGESVSRLVEGVRAFAAENA